MHHDVPAMRRRPMLYYAGKVATDPSVNPDRE